MNGGGNMNSPKEAMSLLILAAVKWEVLIYAFRTQAMRKFSVRMCAHIIIHMLPASLIITYFFA